MFYTNTCSVVKRYLRIVRWLAIVLVAIGIVIAVAWGFEAVLVYGFFATVAASVSYAAARGGSFITGASRGRFKDDDRTR